MTAKRNVRIASLLGSRKSLFLATTNDDESPLASYAPYYWDDRDFFILVSRLSPHTANLLDRPQASVLIIEDESETEDIFARRRVSFQCDVETILDSDPEFVSILDAMKERLGETLQVLRSLPDFILFRLRPNSGRFVEGFGRAYDMTKIAELASRPVGRQG